MARKKQATYWDVSSRSEALKMAKDLRKQGWIAKANYDKDAGWGVFEYGRNRNKLRKKK